jgi:isopentenyldiphosphate isomerase
MMIPIVDEHDTILGYKERSELEDSDIIRVVGLWITDQDGRILLAQRHRDKKRDPLKWWPAVAGTVEWYESYETTLIRESYEEIGIENFSYEVSEKSIIDTWISRYFSQWYRATVSHDHPLILQDDEIAQIRWIDPSSLRDEYVHYPHNFVPSFRYLHWLFF